MTEVIVGGEHLKPETVEVLKELESEGHTLAGVTPEEKPAEQPKVEEPQKPQVAEPAPAEKPEEAEAKGEQPKSERKVDFVPFKKFDAVRHELAEAREAKTKLEAQIAALSQKPAAQITGQAESIAKQYAEALGLDESYTAKLAEMVETIAAGKAQLPAEVAEKLKVLDKYEQLTVQAEEEKAFSQDFDNTVLKEMPQLAEHKDKIKQLAYTEGYTSTSLRAIALEYAHDNGLLQKGRKTLEKGSAGRTTTTEALDFDSLSEDQARALPDDQWEKYVEHQIAKQRQSQGTIGGSHK